MVAAKRKTMKLSDFKNVLSSLEKISFRMPDGKFVEDHIHITEVGMLNKHFIPILL